MTSSNKDFHSKKEYTSVLFTDLTRLKNNAKYLKKILKIGEGIEISSQLALDDISEMCGWSSWNTLYLACQNRNDSNLPLWSELKEIEKRSLLLKNSRILRKYPDNIANLVLDAMSPMVDKVHASRERGGVLSAFKKKAATGVPYQLFSKARKMEGFAISHESSFKIPDYICKEILPNFSERGCVFYCPEHIALNYMTAFSDAGFVIKHTGFSDSFVKSQDLKKVDCEKVRTAPNGVDLLKDSNYLAEYLMGTLESPALPIFNKLATHALIKYLAATLRCEYVRGKEDVINSLIRPLSSMLPLEKVLKVLESPLKHESASAINLLTSIGAYPLKEGGFKLQEQNSYTYALANLSPVIKSLEKTLYLEREMLELGWDIPRSNEVLFINATSPSYALSSHEKGMYRLIKNKIEERDSEWAPLVFYPLEKASNEDSITLNDNFKFDFVEANKLGVSVFYYGIKDEIKRGVTKLELGTSIVAGKEVDTLEDYMGRIDFIDPITTSFNRKRN